LYIPRTGSGIAASGRYCLLRGAMRRALSVLLAAVTLCVAAPVLAQGTLRIAMTAADVPIPNGQTDQGAEGMRFIGYTVFDALINWDLSSVDKPAPLTPGLAAEWNVDPKDRTRWTFRIRDGVRFHDGSTFNAQAAVWNFEKLLNTASPQYDPKQAAQGRGRIPSVKSYRAIDDRTLEIVTTEADALLPYQLSFITMSSPAQWEKVGRSWDRFVQSPSGTGPWKVERYVPRERAELVRNADYWDAKRIPRAERMVLLPVPDASARIAALLSGQVDWIEAPPPDAIPQLRAKGFQITANVYPHIWPWHFSRLDGSPWNDIRVRKAANLAIDRDGMKKLLGGMMVEAKGMVPPNSPWFGKPAFDIRYDPAEARRLLKEAGYSKEKPLVLKTIISASGSGQMQPLLMNEYIQQNLAEVGIKVEFDVLEWNALVANWRAGAKDASTRGAVTTNSSYFAQDPFTALIRHLDSSLVAPRGTNWGYYADGELDTTFKVIRYSFDPEVQLRAVQRAHERFVNEALFLFVAHDVGPRALSPRLKGFRQAQSWYQDFSTVSVAAK
jgi:peptide/nickel transport system substrate-binding protein